MDELDNLKKRRASLRGEKEGMEAQLRNCSSDDAPLRRKLRVQIAMIDDKILYCSDRIRDLERQAQLEREREIMAAQKAERQRQRDEDAEYQAVLAALLEANRLPRAVNVPLKELAKSYRYQADVVRHRIQLVSEMRPRTAAGEAEWEERLRILTAMQRDLRDMAVICERYYQPGYRICEKYSIMYL